MNTRPKARACAAILTVITTLALFGGARAQETPSYLVAVGDAYTITPLMSVGDTAPTASGGTYQMIGIPDGLAAFKKKDGTRVVYMNHEIRFDVLTEPLVGEPLRRGAIVSRLTLNGQGEVLTGGLAFDKTYLGDTFVGEAATDANETPAFGRFCSSSLPGKEVGFTRRIYLTNEEAGAGLVFDPLGGSTVAIFKNEAHALPDLGHFDKENSLVMAGTRRKTVIMSLEDGPNTPDSQLYMYVGRKSLEDDATVLEANGLVGGKLYVFASTIPGVNNEATFTQGSITGAWRLLEGAATMTDEELEAAADTAGAFGFIRMEDGAFSKTVPNEFFFVTTGGNADAGNALGRAYRLVIDPERPATSGATMQLLYDGAAVQAAGADIALGPDNLDTSADYLMISEGGTGVVKPLLAGLGRDLGVWRFPLSGRRHTNVNVEQRDFIAELQTPGRDGIAVPAGSWESSGIVDTTGIFGAGSWLIDVQAHPPTTPPGANTFQDGQLLLMRRAAV